jgi:Fe2+ transport system protein FeoA
MELTPLKPLSAVEAGQTVKLVTIEAGQGLRSRLLAMGLVPNAGITVVSSGGPGPFVISVKGTKMMLGRGMAHKIMVM